VITKCSIWQEHSKCSVYRSWSHNLWDDIWKPPYMQIM
jgi:hypothetical protein